MIVMLIIGAAWVGSFALGLVAAATRDASVALVLSIVGLLLAPTLAALVWLIDQGSSGDGDLGYTLIQLGLLLTWPVSLGAWALGRRLGRR